MIREFPDRPIAGVGVVVVRDGRVLMVRRARPPRQGLWSLPGGAQELGETVFAAAGREVREETGIEIEVLGLIDVVDSITREGEERVRYHYTLIEVAARGHPGEIVAGDDAAEARWFAEEEIGALELWSETRRIIRLGLEMADALAAAGPEPSPLSVRGTRS